MSPWSSGDSLNSGNLNAQTGFRVYVDASPYSADSSGAASSSTSIANAISAVSNASGGQVLFSAGTYLVDRPIFLPSRVYLVGQGHASTILRMASSAHTSVVLQQDFSTLSGANLSNVTAGVHYGCGIVGLTVDGNRSSNNTGYGVALYSKNYYINDVLIRDCPEVGFYSEGGTSAIVSSWQNTPESRVDNLTVRSCGSHGILFRGPHDTIFGQVVSSNNTGWGWYTDTSGVYDGHCDVRNLHTYTCQLGSVYIGTTGHYGLVQADSDTPGLHIAGSNVVVETFRGTAIGQTRVDGGSVPTSAQTALFINGSFNNVGQVKIAFDSRLSGGCGIAFLTGSQNVVGPTFIHGNSGNTGLIGLDVDTNDCVVSPVMISNLTMPRCVGVRLGNASGRVRNTIMGNLVSCASGFHYVNAGDNNIVILSIAGDSTTSNIVGITPSVDDRFILNTSGGGRQITSHNTASATFAVDSTGVKTVGIAHGLPYAPYQESCQLTIGGASVNDWVAGFVNVSAVGTSLVTATVSVTSAGAAGGTARLMLRTTQGI